MATGAIILPAAFPPTGIAPPRVPCRGGNSV